MYAEVYVYMVNGSRYYVVPRFGRVPGSRDALTVRRRKRDVAVTVRVTCYDVLHFLVSRVVACGVETVWPTANRKSETRGNWQQSKVLPVLHARNMLLKQD